MSRKKFLYYKIYKPYGIISQFSDSENHSTLKTIHKFPKDVYSVGRLDADSEGLLLLTNDRSLTDFLLNPENKHKREYCVQVEGIPDENDLQKLRNGIVIKDKKTLPAEIELIIPPQLPERNPPIRFRKNVPDSWLRIILTEGKNRQVRRMTAAIGFPTLRLVRTSIENILLGNMKPGEVKELSEKEVKDLMKLKRR